jgi:TonB family protein
MRESVSDILAERAQLTGSANRMVLLSLVAHGALLSTMILMPTFWQSATATNEKVMEISLGGVEGPSTGGMTPPSARKVDEVAERDPRARPDAPPPPKPEMVEATPATKPAPKPTAKPIEETKPKETGRKPAIGAEVSKGTARVETNSPAQVPFGGLSTGGGGFGGTEINIAGFCCPEYIRLMQQRIHSNWQRKQSVTGRVVISFTVLRDGRIVNITIRESGGQFLDLVSQRALVATRQLPPLPAEYTNPTLTVDVVLNYVR